MAGYTYKVDLVPNLDQLVKKMGSTQAALLQVAEQVASAAIGIAPVGAAAMDSHPGEYRDSISSGAAGQGAVVVAKAPHSHWVEFGVPAHGIPAKAVLARAAESVGLTLGSP